MVLRVPQPRSGTQAVLCNARHHGTPLSSWAPSSPPFPSPHTLPVYHEKGRCVISTFTVTVTLVKRRRMQQFCRLGKNLTIECTHPTTGQGLNSHSASYSCMCVVPPCPQGSAIAVLLWCCCRVIVYWRGVWSLLDCESHTLCCLLACWLAWSQHHTQQRCTASPHSSSTSTCEKA